MAEEDQRVFGKLMALAYDKENALCWQAIEAMGFCAKAVASVKPARVRKVVQRIIWSAREESGGMGWSAPELLAEIVSACPKHFADIPPIIVSLHGEDEEKVFLKGVLWAIARMADAGIRSLPGSEEVVLKSLIDVDPMVRGLALRAAIKDEIIIPSPQLKDLAGDEGRFSVYKEGSLMEKTVAETARAALPGRV